MGTLVVAGCSDLIGADWGRYSPGGGEGAAGSGGGGAAAGSGGAGAGGGAQNDGGGAGAGAGGAGVAGAGAGGAGVGGGGGEGGSSIPRSCAELDGRCGPHNISCCDSKLVDGGSYDRSYRNVTEPRDARRATVSRFRLDTYEITVGRFIEFVKAGKGTQADPPEENVGEHPELPGSGWIAAFNRFLAADTETLRGELKACNPDNCGDISPRCATWNGDDASADDDALPMNCITWYEALAFCAWDGGRLPTEAEWNYAAAGGAEARTFPWGSSFDQSRVVSNCLGDGDEGRCTTEDFLEVGSRSTDDEQTTGDGRWGQADLAGSLLEWTLDGFSTRFQTSCDGCTSCDDCANLSDTTDRVMRGGSFEDPEEQLVTNHRLPGDPAARYYGIGARCARDR
ncbi:formylglycine-generating enzyme family protein [Sorangium sp. So ce726]|uniref:formylglycine-generating enzyme family protein n=1 Tax=Sorangium sp. So ce726 TaxID=3133319 RepID=UPI003F62A4AF